MLSMWYCACEAMSSVVFSSLIPPDSGGNTVLGEAILEKVT
jgi:hypothetical protein